MPAENRKLKLLHLAQYRMDHTDAEHGVTVEEPGSGLFTNIPHNKRGLSQNENTIDFI